MTGDWELHELAELLRARGVIAGSGREQSALLVLYMCALFELASGVRDSDLFS